MNAKNKVSFISFVLNVLVEYLLSVLQSHQEVIVGRLDGSSWRISSHGKEQLPELFCDHEEAGSCLFLYASYCSSNTTVSRIVVFSSDTDVIVIDCYHCNHKLQNCSGEKICRVLPSFHCLTGRDSTGSFSGTGKKFKKSFKVLSENLDSLGTLDQLGEKPTLEKESDGVHDAIKLVCLLYDSKCQVFDINHLRYKLFCSKNLSGEKLPQTHDTLILHLSRVAFQVYIWMNAHKTSLDLSSPTDNEWILKNGKLEQHLMSQVPARRKVAEFILCRCKKNCKTNNCSCRKSNLVCTEACLCDNCENWVGNCESDSDSEND